MATLSSWGSTGILVRHSAEWGGRERTVRGAKRGKGGELDFISLFQSKIRSGPSTTQNADNGRPNRLHMTAKVSADIEPRIFGQIVAENKIVGLMLIPLLAPSSWLNINATSAARQTYLLRLVSKFISNCQRLDAMR